MQGKASKNDDVRLEDLLPPEVNGWKSKGEDKIYTPATIFDYIDGAGEVYRSYNFRRLLVKKYGKEEKPEIVADLFDMGCSEDAFGVFTHDLEGQDVGIGQGSTYKGGLLSFWKERFFVSLYAEEETGETREALMALGRAVEASIKREGRKPEILSLFPHKSLDRTSLRYFHNHILLNYHFFVADENILLLDQKTEASLGTYREGEEVFRLLLIRYPETGRAAEAYRTFVKNYMPDAAEAGIIRREDGRWTAVRFRGRFVFIVFEAPTEDYAREYMENVERRIEEMMPHPGDRGKRGRRRT